MYNLFKTIFKSKADCIINYDVCLNISEAIAELEDKGFAVILLLDENGHNLFYEDSLRFLEQVSEKHPKIDFLAIGRSEYKEIRQSSQEIVKKHLQKPLSAIFDKEIYNIIYGLHLLKSNNKKSILNPHQDSSHVDELMFASYHLWMPVSNPCYNFGTLQLIPYSHKLNIPYRSLNIPWVLSKYEKKLWKYMQSLHLKAGQAVIFNSRMIHASGQNTTEGIRIAVNSLIIPKLADFIHFYTDKNSNHREIELYKITPDFYYNEDILKRPQNYPLIKKVTNVNSSYSLKELDTIFTQNNLR
jgi:hypothetical protein